ncbi:uncharacterized protein LOC128993091 [Macrosteles quadrilineatus]|uniref:uncharacterized protein LOC128993091 n=1 Tax=Macrosteles quadrilineatus TaxID=74068 RepID=UPI0023E19856|nr:uncharacterized protein LOC128993091 [Macrosteles quadrilineatus]
MRIVLAVFATVVAARAEISYQGGLVVKEGPLSYSEKYNPGPQYNQVGPPCPGKYRQDVQTFNSFLNSPDAGQTFVSSLNSEDPGQIFVSSLNSEDPGQTFVSSLNSPDVGQVFLNHPPSCSCGCQNPVGFQRVGPPQYSGPPQLSGPPQYSGPPQLSGPPKYSGPPQYSGPPKYSGPPQLYGPPQPGPQPLYAPNYGPSFPASPPARPSPDCIDKPSPIMKIPRRSDSSITITVNPPESNSVYPRPPTALQPRPVFYARPPPLLTSCPAVFYPAPAFPVYPPFTCPARPYPPNVNPPPPQKLPPTTGPKGGEKTFAGFSSSIPGGTCYNVTSTPEKRDPLLPFKLLSAAASKNRPTTPSPSLQADAPSSDCSMPIPPNIL